MDRNAVRRDSSFVSSSTSSSVLVSKVSNAPLTNLDEDTWHELAGKDEFKNWLRICLGLKVCMEFLAPHITRAVEKSFAEFDRVREAQNNKKFTKEEVHKLRGMSAKQREKHFYWQWAREMRKQHRNQNASVKWLAGHALKFSDPTKWHCPDQGPWDMARVYMTGGNMLPRGSSWKSFDAAALLLYIKSNRTCDEFIEDVQVVRKLADVRNEMMHCPGYMCHDDRLDENFGHMFRLLRDGKLSELASLRSTEDKLRHVKCANLNILLGDANGVLEKNDKKEIPFCKENNFGRPEKLSVRRTKSEPVKTTQASNMESESENQKLFAPTQAHKNPQDNNFKQCLKQRLKSSQESLFKLIKRQKSTDSASFSCSSKSAGSGGGNKSAGSRGGGKGKSGKNKEGSSSSGGGKGYFQDKLRRGLRAQDPGYEADFDVEHRKGKFYCQVKFTAGFAAMNRQPKMTEEDAIEAAAVEALKQQGAAIDEGDPCKSLDLLCRAKTGLPPVYHVAPFSQQNVWVSTLQVFTPRATKKDVFVEAKVSSRKKGREAEAEAAQACLQDHRNFHKMRKRDYKRALKEHCVANGGTIPIYGKSSPYTTTVTSFVRSKMTLESNDDDEDILLPDSVVDSSPLPEDESKVKENLARLGEVDFDMVESVSLVPMRSKKCAEESAAKSMLTNLCGSQEEEEEVPAKKRLESFSEIAKWPHAFHTDRIKCHQELHDCVVVSRCLDRGSAEFVIAGDGRGRRSAHEAREAAARKAVFMMGMESK